MAWWALSDDERYLWEHLIEHLLDAERPGDAEGTASDLRWVAARLQRFGPAAPAADLSTIGTPQAARLQAVLTRVAHLLAPTEPTGAVIDVLHSQIATDPYWAMQVTALRNTFRRPRLVNRWPLPDLTSSALQRTLSGHTGRVNTVAVAPDGRWLATGGADSAVRIWDTASWQQHATLSPTRWGVVVAVAIATTGRWLAECTDATIVRIWDTDSWEQRATLAGHTESVRAVEVAPDGRWLATVSIDKTVRIWDTARWRKRAILTGHTGWVNAVAVAPDGRWLATGGSDKTVRIWDTASWQQRAILAGDTSWVNAVAVAPDGRWLATGGDADGADLGYGQLAAARHLDRPHEQGERGGGGAGRPAGWPPAARIRPCGSGIRPAGSSAPSWPATPNR